MHKTAAPSYWAVLYFDLSNCTSSTREDTVVANAKTKEVDERDTKTFPKSYVSRNGK